MIEGTRRLNARICGPQRDVLRTLRSIPEITTAELFGEREGDSFVYSIESTAGVDIRKPLFYTLAKNNMPLIGLEQQGTNLEDIFISLIDKKQDSRKSKKDASGFDETPSFDIKFPEGTETDAPEESADADTKEDNN